MKKGLTPVAYPTTKEEEFRWGFDLYPPKGTPLACIIDWDSASAGFSMPLDRIMEVVKFKLGKDDLGKLTVDDILAGHARMFKTQWHHFVRHTEEKWGTEKALELAYALGYTMGDGGWQYIEKVYGKPFPINKLPWYQDYIHMLYGPDTHAYTWHDEEKAVCTRHGCLFRPSGDIDPSRAKFCRTYCDGYIDAYMDVEPDLYCIRVPDMGDNCEETRCIHLWTYDKKVIENLPQALKDGIRGTTRERLIRNGANL